ncbi:unnamed protein product [Pleuronectes platessa]|uniref:Uncharacterized protein n=1 Tax=Pleuronectes platessa TaxID=8262 RepID=A0A9N7U9F5_PLEPL|nr:unnamed protein product [Pleuronectes platessa]
MGNKQQPHRPVDIVSPIQLIHHLLHNMVILHGATPTVPSRRGQSTYWPYYHEEPDVWERCTRKSWGVASNSSETTVRHDFHNRQTDGDDTQESRSVEGGSSRRFRSVCCSLEPLPPRTCSLLSQQHVQSPGLEPVFCSPDTPRHKKWVKLTKGREHEVTDVRIHQGSRGGGAGPEAGEQGPSPGFKSSKPRASEGKEERELEREVGGEVISEHNHNKGGAVAAVTLAPAPSAPSRLGNGHREAGGEGGRERGETARVECGGYRRERERRERKKREREREESSKEIEGCQEEAKMWEKERGGKMEERGVRRGGDEG